jgi:hypothetical protein
MLREMLPTQTQMVRCLPRLIHIRLFTTLLTYSFPAGLPKLLLSYQETVTGLLHLRSFPDVSIQQLEKFRRDFGCTAFTCRVEYCPFASTGFDNAALRDEHEQTHAPRISCHVPGCQYPPFRSTRALKSHLTKIHNNGAPKVRIKQAHGGESEARWETAGLDLDWDPSRLIPYSPHPPPATLPQIRSPPFFGLDVYE